MNKFKLFILGHKIIISILLIVVIGGGYWWYRSSAANMATTRYVTAPVEKGTLTVSVSGTGQVNPTSTLEIKPTSSGTVESVSATQGKEMKIGDIILTLDQRDAKVKLAQARATLAQAQSSYDNTVGGTTAAEIKSARLSLSQAEGALEQAKKDYANTITTLDQAVNKATKDLANLEDSDQSNTTQEQAIASAIVDLDEAKRNGQASIDSKKSDLFSTIKSKISSATSALDSINKIFEDQNIKPTLGLTNSLALYQARVAYASAMVHLDLAKSATTLADTDKSEAHVLDAYDKTYSTFQAIADATNGMFGALQGTISSSSISQSQIDAYKSSMSSQSTSVASTLVALESAKQAIVDAQNSYDTAVRKAEQSLNQSNLSYKNSLLTARDTLESAQASKVTQTISAQTKLTNAQNTVSNAKLQLEKTLASVTGAEVRSAQASVDSASAALQSAQSDFDSTVIKAPFDGQLASISVKAGDQVGTEVIATLVTNTKVAEITLNETDIAKIKVGQKSILTFDALDSLSITGTVAQVDVIGTITQNVVSYKVQILFDTDDDLVKPGMSVSASVITDVKQDVLLIASAAVKNNGTDSYVEVLQNNTPIQKTVQVGAANDTQTEISGDIAEGDEAITQTISSTTKTTSTTQSTGSLLQGLSGGGGGARNFGGAERAPAATGTTAK